MKTTTGHAELIEVSTEVSFGGVAVAKTRMIPVADLANTQVERIITL